MQIVRYNPFRELEELEKDLGRMIDRGWGIAPNFTDATIDMYVKDGQLVAEASLPNFKKEEIKVSATETGLEINAEHEEKEEGEKDRRYFLKESAQSYWRRLSLPPGAKKEDVKCSFKDGKLTIAMPFEEQRKTKAIPIN